MIAKAPKRVSHQTLKSRRLEIEQRLAAFGLVRGPRRVIRGETTADFEESLIRRLRGVLGELGPIFSSFGLYLSSRADLLPAADCLELGTIPDRADATPPGAVGDVLRDEFRRFPEEVFTAIDKKPFESRLLFQSHRAVLKDGRQVIVKLIHPEMEGEYAADLDLLPLLRDAFVDAGINEPALKCAEVDFCHSLEQKMDFLNEARAFEQISQEAEEHNELVVPQVYQHVNSARVLIIENLNGLRLDHLFSSIRDANSRLLLADFGFEPRELARLLCEIWLRQALRSRYFPVEPNATNLLVLPNKKVAFTGGAFASVPPGPQANLWDYLIAAASENSENACTYLLKEMTRTAASISDDDLRQRFKQAVPFRDGGWSISGDCQSLAELLFVQWRFASECGYQPLAHLPTFYRGLFSIADVARRLAPAIDPLREGLRDVRLLGGVAQFRDMISFSEFADQFDRYAAMMVELPRSVDEVLTHAAETQIRTGSRRSDSDSRMSDRNFSTLLTAMLLGLAGFVLLSQYLSATAVAGIWLDRMSAIAFAAMSALILLAVSSRG